MALKTFAPEPGPSPGTRNSPEVKILEAEFGDGYNQSTPDGFNHIRRTLSLTWETLSAEQAETILTFFVEHGGTRPFYYTPANECVPVKWTCKTWDSVLEGSVKVTAEFKQSFTLET